MTREIPQLTDLQDTVDDLLAVLKDETTALRCDDLTQLAGVTDQKRVMIDSLIEFAEGELKQAHEGAPNWDQFVQSLTECKQRNMINGASMNAMAGSRRDALRVLYGQERQHDYGRDGQVQDAPTGRNLGQA